MKARRIALHDAADEVIAWIDISQIDHANTQAAMHISVDTMCDMEHWHEHWRGEVPPFGRRIER